MEGRGWHSVAIDIGGQFIAKFPAGSEAEEALRREARLLGAARPFLTTPVPDMTLHEGPPLFSLHAKLPGRPLERADYARLDEHDRDRLAHDLVRFLVELHAIDPAVMREAGAAPIEVWDTSETTLAPIWPLLPAAMRMRARDAMDEYRSLRPDPGGEVYGFFDAHGWNLAFDHEAGRLEGIFDFADSGFGPIHREFVQISLIDADLAARTADAYEGLTGRRLERRRIFLLTAAQRLSELAGAMETGEHVAGIQEYVTEWFGGQREPT